MTDESTIQYLNFTLDGEAFATEITKVREVLEYTEVTPIPRAPEYMKGVINLRGNVIPVIDMRLQFGMAVAEVSVDTCIIIIEVDIDDCATVVGVLADSVQEVIYLKSEQMQSPPSLGTRIDTRFIQAIGKTNEGDFIILLNMDKIFCDSRLRELETPEADVEASDEAQEVA